MSDYGPMQSFSTVLVVIETDAGLVGLGETKAGGALPASDASIANLINHELGPCLMGLDPRNVTRIWELLYNGPRAGAAASAGRTFPSLARRGLAMCAISAIDIALWDILGKSAGLPVWQLLGGATRPALPVYASGGWGPASAIGEEVLSYLRHTGASAVKMRVGSKYGSVGASIERVQAARAAIGPDIELMVDAHGTYSLAEAKLFAAETQAARLRWFEEPVSGDQKRNLAELRVTCCCALAAGENDSTRFDFVPYLETRGLDVFQPDLGMCGGITEARVIAALAGACQIEVSPHLWGGTILAAATAHFAIACPQVAIFEYPASSNPMIGGLATGGFSLSAGMLSVSDEPGFGVSLDEDFVARCAA